MHHRTGDGHVSHKSKIGGFNWGVLNFEETLIQLKSLILNG